MEYNKFTITTDDTGRRIDRIVRKFLPNVPLSSIYALLRKGLIRFNGQKVAQDFVIHIEGEIWIACLDSLAAFSQKKNEKNFTPLEDLASFPFEIVFKSNDLLCINKPFGYVVHGTNGLDEIVARYFQNNTGSLSFSVGPLHRLDKETTGLLFFSQSLKGAQWFSKEIASHSIEKRYIGIFEGHLSSREYWIDSTKERGKMITEVFPLAYSIESQSRTLVGFRIKTGKKHQIRIQSSKRGHPLCGDVRYGSSVKGPFFLHAYQIKFNENRLAPLPQILTAPLPQSFINSVDELFGTNVLASCLSRTVYWNEYE